MKLCHGNPAHWGWHFPENSSVTHLGFNFQAAEQGPAQIIKLSSHPGILGIFLLYSKEEAENGLSCPLQSSSQQVSGVKCCNKLGLI